MRLFVIIFFAFFSLSAKDTTISAFYDIGFGIMGKIGEAEMSLEVKDDNYKISAKAKSKNVAALMSAERFELYESEGKIVNGEFIPQHYKTLVQNNNKYDKSVYDIYHDAKRVLRYRERINSENEKQISQEVVPYYGQDDLMTLFFNLALRTKNQNIGETKKFIAVGGEKKSGEVEITFPKNDESSKLKEKYKQEGKVVKVKINQPVFVSESGELLLFLDGQNLCQKGVLEGLVLFGDVVGVMMKNEIKEQ